MFVYLFICLSFFLSIYLSVCLSIYIVYINLDSIVCIMIIYIYIYQYTHIFYIIKLYTCICTCMYTCIYNHINMCVYVYIHVYMRFMIPQRERSRYPTAPGQLGDRSRGYGQGLEKAGDGNGALGPDCCGISSFETRLSPAGRKPPEGRLPQLRV